MGEVPLGWMPLFVHGQRGFAGGGCLGTGVRVIEGGLCFPFIPWLHLTWLDHPHPQPLRWIVKMPRISPHAVFHHSLWTHPTCSDTSFVPMTLLASHLDASHSELVQLAVIYWAPALCQEDAGCFTFVIVWILLMTFQGRWWYFQLIYQKVEVIVPKPHN